MNGRIMVPVLAIALAPLALQAQASGEMTATMAVEAAVRAGLPDAPVRKVIQQGEARSMAQARIDQAASATYQRLVLSREALRAEGHREPTPTEITFGAEALASGASAMDLSGMSRAAPADRSLATSLGVLAELTVRGEPSARAATTIASRLRAGASDRAIGALSAAGGLASTGVGGGARAVGAAGAGVSASGGAGLSAPGASLGGSVAGVASIGGL